MSRNSRYLTLLENNVIQNFVLTLFKNDDKLMITVQQNRGMLYKEVMMRREECISWIIQNY